MGLLAEADAQDHLKDLYKEIKETMGAPVVPNFFKAQAAVSPMIVNHTSLLVKGILCNGKLGRVLNEKILTAISWARHCDYCESAHLAFLKVLGVSLTEMELLCGRWDELPDDRERAVIRFAVKCATDARDLKYRDYDGLRKQGLTDEDIAELVTMSAFSVYVNTIASGMKVPTDDTFNRILNRPLGTP